MLCNVIKSNKNIEQNVSLSHAEAVELSKLAEVAAVLDLNESPNGFLVIYQDGVARLYDPVENIIIGKHAEFSKRNGWF